MADYEPEHLAAATRNLLFDCGGFAPGDRVLFCHEPARLGWYDDGLGRAVAAQAGRQGLDVSELDVGAPDDPLPAAAVDTLEAAENVVYFARIGDQGRFGAQAARRREIMVYARRFDHFTSLFGRLPHARMIAEKAWVDGVMAGASSIEISCPNGTRLRGRVTGASAAHPPRDTTVQRFPLGVPAPIPADAFSGEVALFDTLTPTGNRSYQPAVLPLSARVMAVIEQGRIVDFTGPAPDVARIRGHYEHVAGLFGIDPYVMHSWHAGIHPAGPFFERDDMDADYWSNTVFCSPQLLHFHTCGAFAPGEISWNIRHATVLADGKPVWDAGRYVRESRAMGPAQ